MTSTGGAGYRQVTWIGAHPDNPRGTIANSSKLCGKTFDHFGFLTFHLLA